MPYKITLSKKAFSELEEAFLWYRESSAQAASKFYAGVLARIDEITTRPHVFGPVRKRPRYRRAKIKRFPYLIVFLIDEGKQHVFILSIWHEHRKPAGLLRRLKK